MKKMPGRHGTETSFCEQTATRARPKVQYDPIMLVDGNRRSDCNAGDSHTGGKLQFWLHIQTRVPIADVTGLDSKLKVHGLRDSSVEPSSMGREHHERLLPHQVQSRRHGEGAQKRADGTRPAGLSECTEGGAQPGVPDDGHALRCVPCDDAGETDVADEAAPRPLL